jgi:hypothetical protein
VVLKTWSEVQSGDVVLLHGRLLGVVATEPAAWNTATVRVTPEPPHALIRVLADDGRTYLEGECDLTVCMLP